MTLWQAPNTNFSQILSLQQSNGLQRFSLLLLLLLLLSTTFVEVLCNLRCFFLFGLLSVYFVSFFDPLFFRMIFFFYFSGPRETDPATVKQTTDKHNLLTGDKMTLSPLIMTRIAEQRFAFRVV